MDRPTLDDQLRIVLISTARGFHGGEQQAALLLSGLVQRGHDCLAIVPARSELANRYGDDQNTHAHVPAPSRADSPKCWPVWGRGLGPWAALQVRRALADHRPDVVLLNDPHAVTMWQVQRWWETARQLVGGRRIPYRPLVFAARRVDFPLNRPGRYVRYCDGLLCVSRAIAEQCHRDGVPGHQLFVVYDGVDPQRMTGGDPQRGRALARLGADDGPLIVCVARLADHKGHRYLLEAMARLTDQFPRSVLALAGDGELLEPLRQQAQRLGIDDRVRFLGYTQQVPDLLAAAQLSVISSHMEGLCSSIIDSMFARCPVVATAAGGIPDLLGPTDDDPRDVGWLVPPRDPQALAEAMREALVDSSLRASHVAAAYQRALHRFTSQAMVERTELICRAVASGRSAPLSYAENGCQRRAEGVSPLF